MCNIKTCSSHVSGILDWELTLANGQQTSQPLRQLRQLRQSHDVQLKDIAGWTSTVSTKPTTAIAPYTPESTFSRAFAPGTDTDCDFYFDVADTMDNSSPYLGTSSSEWIVLGYSFSDCSLYKSLFTLNVTQLVPRFPGTQA